MIFRVAVHGLAVIGLLAVILAASHLAGITVVYAVKCPPTERK